MFIPFFLELKAARVPVSLREYLTGLEGMEAGLVTYDVEGFYYLARAALVKDERHIDKHIWQLPIPSYDAADATHREIALLGREVADLVHSTSIDTGLHFPALRRHIRHIVEESDAGARISELTYELLS